MTRLLVYRFSAMGDVVLCLPVLKGVLAANDNLEIFFLTQPGFFPVFHGIDRLHLVSADLKGKYKGRGGLVRLFREIRQEVNPDRVIDLHGVLRTYYLDLLFLASGYKVSNFRKGTFRKKWLIRSKSLKPLPSSIERYSEVFTRNGFQINLPDPPLLPKTGIPVEFSKLIDQSIVIGIAPFAKHQQKIWGITKVENLIAEINKLYNASIVLFGGGPAELKILNQLSAQFPNCIVSANYYRFEEEIQLFPQLSVMVSMDSANMHLASMAGVPTISIWGATHPSLGFAPYKQPAENMIQYNGDKTSCRPCSVYGNKKCIYSDGIRCMEYIPVDAVLDRINQILRLSVSIR